MQESLTICRNVHWYLRYSWNLNFISLVNPFVAVVQPDVSKGNVSYVCDTQVKLTASTATMHIFGCNFAPNTKMMSAWNLCQIIFVTLSILRDSSCLNSTSNGLSKVMDTVEWKAMVNLNNETTLIGRGWREPLSADMSFVFSEEFHFNCFPALSWESPVTV